MTDNMERVAEIGRKIKALQAQQEDIVEAIENLKAKELELLDGIEGDYIVGDNDNGFLKINIYQSKTYNEAWGKKNAPELWEKFAEEVRVLTSARAKDKMTPEEYANFQKASAKKSVKVEVINDDN